jgi:hypothetical protein
MVTHFFLLTNEFFRIFFKHIFLYRVHIFASLINNALFLDGQFSVVPRTRQFYVMPRTGLNNPHYSERFWVS